MKTAQHNEREDGGLLDRALDAVRRALDVGGGTAVCAPAARADACFVDGRSGARATVCVVGSDVFFLLTPLASSSSPQRRTGWYRLSLPTQQIHHRRTP